MADFWSIAIGLFGFFALCALIAWFTDRGDDACDEHSQHLGIGGGGFFHNGEAN